jgi:hypothetical protein
VTSTTDSKGDHVTGEQMGDVRGRRRRQTDLQADREDGSISSVVYLGRGSFRMEAVALDPERATGIVQPMLGAVTAPLHRTQVEELDDQDAHAPHLRALFSSQTNVPILAAPTGSASLHVPVVAVSPALLATLGGLVLLCGIIVGTASRHLLALPAPLALAATPSPEAAPLPASPASIAPPATAVPIPPPPEAPAMVTTRVRARPIARHPQEPTEASPAKVWPAKPKTGPAKPKTGPAKPKTWIDPWAD